MCINIVLSLEFSQLKCVYVCKQEIPLRSNVYEVYAMDKDEGLNGAVQYNLLKTGAGNKDWEYFTIDPKSGLIQTAMRLDREKQAVYSVCPIYTTYMRNSCPSHLMFFCCYKCRNT